jgi:hypothetical protein
MFIMFMAFYDVQNCPTGRMRTVSPTYITINQE